MTKIQCNWCMNTYTEDKDNLVTDCTQCNTDNFMMELINE